MFPLQILRIRPLPVDINQTIREMFLNLWHQEGVNSYVTRTPMCVMIAQNQLDNGNEAAPRWPETNYPGQTAFQALRGGVLRR